MSFGEILEKDVLSKIKKSGFEGELAFLSAGQRIFESSEGGELAFGRFVNETFNDLDDKSRATLIECMMSFLLEKGFLKLAVAGSSREMAELL